MYNNGLDSYMLYKEIEELEMYARIHINENINIWDVGLKELVRICSVYLNIID